MINKNQKKIIDYYFMNNNDISNEKNGNSLISRRKFLSSIAAISGSISLFGISNLKTIPNNKKSEKSIQIWWIGTDAHVAYRKMRIRNGYDHNLETCIDDVNKLRIADFAIILGDLGGADLQGGMDIIQTGNNVSRFIPAMKKLDVKEWHYITGNHEFNDAGEIVIPAKYWSQTIFGIKFIFISDEKPDYGGFMNKQQEEWFFSELNRSPKQPVFIFSHQPPDSHGSWNFWDKLEKKIKDYNIQAWIHGHTHNWSIDEETIYGFRRIGISSIYEYTGKEEFPSGDEAHNNGCFLILCKYGQSISITFRFRNHGKRQWISVNGKKEVAFTIDL